jgi:hypothetical protein
MWTFLINFNFFGKIYFSFSFFSLKKKKTNKKLFIFLNEIYLNPKKDKKYQKTKKFKRPIGL